MKLNKSTIYVKVVVSLLFVLAVGFTLQSITDEIVATSEGSTYQYPTNEAALLWDNTSTVSPTTSGIISSRLRGVNDTNDVTMADNFTVPAATTWLIDSIVAPGFNSAGSQQPDSVNFVIRLDNGGAPGAILHSVNKTGIVTSGSIAPITGKFTPPLAVPTGNYWLEIATVYDTNTVLSTARWNWNYGAVANGPVPQIRQRASYFGPPANWQPVTNLVPADQSQVFNIFGTAGAPPTPSSLCFSRSGLNKAIPDNNLAGGVYDTIHVTANAGNIDDITIVIDNIQHTWVGDLICDVTHAGQTDTLLSRIGTGGVGNSTDNLMGLRFTDSATVPIASFLVNTTPIPPGNYLPGGRTGVDSLRKHFKNQNLSGDWILRVRDGAALDFGTLEAWSICFYSSNITQIISSNNNAPDKYSLGQNYPNPFNPTTKIKFALPKAGLVSLKVYDMLGREVQTLVNQQLNAGEFIADFDGANLSSGTYFYRLQVGDFVEIKKMVLLK